MPLKPLILKHLKKTLRRREFWFTALLYPAVAAGYGWLKNNAALYSFADKAGIWYFVIAFIALAYIVCYVAVEIIGKKLQHKIQGDKLKLKQEQNWR